MHKLAEYFIGDRISRYAEVMFSKVARHPTHASEWFIEMCCGHEGIKQASCSLTYRNNTVK